MSEFRPRSDTEVLDATFELYRSHFATFFTIAVIGFLPLALARLILSPGGVDLSGPGVNTPSALFGAMSALFLLILGGILSVLVDAAVIAGASEGYLGHPVETGKAMTTAFKRPGSVLAASFLKALFIGFGFALLIVPGVFLFIRYFAVPATVVLENRPTASAMHRSAELADGNRWRIFRLLGGMLILYFVAAVIIGTLLGSLVTGTLATLGVNLIVRAVLYPFYATLTTVLYYDIRIRQEGYDVELMAGALGTPMAAPVPAV